MNRLPFSKQVALVSASCGRQFHSRYQPHDRSREGYYSHSAGSVGTVCAEFHDRTVHNKLTVSYLVGTRDAGCAYEFIKDLASRLPNRVQLTTDGRRVYLDAVESAFGSEIAYATLVKIYGTPAETEKRYSPTVCLGATEATITGSPDRRHISTSYVERRT